MKTIDQSQAESSKVSSFSNSSLTFMLIQRFRVFLLSTFALLMCESLFLFPPLWIIHVPITFCSVTYMLFCCDHCNASKLFFTADIIWSMFLRPNCCHQDWSKLRFAMSIAFMSALCGGWQPSCNGNTRVSTAPQSSASVADICGRVSSCCNLISESDAFESHFCLNDGSIIFTMNRRFSQLVIEVIVFITRVQAGRMRLFLLSSSIVASGQIPNFIS